MMDNVSYIIGLILFVPFVICVASVAYCWPKDQYASQVPAGETRE